MNQVNSFLKSYGITLPDGKAREQTILSGVYGVAEGLCLGVNPVALGAVKAIDMLIHKITTKQNNNNNDRPTYLETNKWGKVAVKAISFAACAGALYAGGFAVPAISRVAVSVGLIVLQPNLSDKIEELAGKKVRTYADLAIQGFTVSTLIGANPLIMISVEITNHVFNDVCTKSFTRSEFSERDKRLVAAMDIGILTQVPFLMETIPMKVATIAFAGLIIARDIAYNSQHAPWLQKYV